MVLTCNIGGGGADAPPLGLHFLFYWFELGEVLDLNFECG